MLTTFRSLFTRRSTTWGVSLADARLADGDRVYAIGDIHGRVDLLESMLEMIFCDDIGDVDRCWIIYLGDYVDRGDHSYAVIDLLLNEAPSRFTVVYLCGNHEEAMLDFLDGGKNSAAWLQFGGMATLMSYGVPVPPGVLTNAKIAECANRFRTVVPEEHLAFLNGLRDSFTLGDYYFAHAGIRPELPLHMQSAKDLRWIRNEFLDCDEIYQKVIVHGHTVTDEPEFRPNRINIDTGAYFSGKLTCLVLERDSRRILTCKRENTSDTGAFRGV